MNTSDHIHKCPRCKEEYPLTPEYWHRNKSRKNGFSHKCKSCSNAELKQWNLDNPDKTKAHSHKYTMKHGEAARQRAKDWYEKNKEYAIERNRHYRIENADKIRESKKQNRVANPEHYKELAKESYQRNKQLFSEHGKRRKARKKGATGTHTSKEVGQLHILQNGLCFHCQADLSQTRYEEDHWIPLSRGGSDYIENIRLLCPKCNRSKGSKLPHEWHPEKYSPDD